MDNGTTVTSVPPLGTSSYLQQARVAPITPRDTIKEVFQRDSYDYGSDSLMQSTSKLTHTGQTPREREKARPTSNTRHNNPHSNKFQTKVLPSGAVINVTANLPPQISPEPSLDGSTNSLSVPDFRTPQTVVQADYNHHQPESWQVGNTKRYGCNSQPWANSSKPVTGVVPDVKPNGTDMASALTTHRDAYSQNGFSRFNATGSRRAPAKVDEETGEDLKTLFRDIATPEVESWIQTAPGFEGEIVKRMLKEVGTRVRLSAGSTREDLGATSPEKPGAPEYRYLSKWTGP